MISGWWSSGSSLSYTVFPFCVTNHCTPPTPKPFLPNVLYVAISSSLVAWGSSFFWTFLAMTLIALFSAAAFFAEKYSPPVAEAIHSSCASVFLSTLNPMTCVTKSIPCFSNSFAVPQGSGSQVSFPSEMRIMVAFSSVYLISSATFLKDRLIGVFPLGLMDITVEMTLSLSIFPTGIMVSISSQLPLVRCP